MKYKKSIIALAAATSIYGAMFFGFPHHKTSSHVKPFLDKNIPLIVKEQEERFGIKYESIPPFEFSARVRKNPRWLSAAKPAVNCA